MKAKLNKSIFIIIGVIPHPAYTLQYFYIYPRYNYQIGSRLYTFVNQFLNTKYIGDRLEKLNFKEERNVPYDNGIFKLLFYEQLGFVDLKETIEHFRIDFELKEDRACNNCEYERNKYCVFLNTELYDAHKFQCEWWEEKEKLYETF